MAAGFAESVQRGATLVDIRVLQRLEEALLLCCCCRRYAEVSSIAFTLLQVQSCTPPKDQPHPSISLRTCKPNEPLD